MDTGVKKSHVDLGNAREKTQVEAMERIRNREECPFCLENLKKEHKEPILFEGNHWVVTPNQWPYEEARNHLLLISRCHAEDFAELPKGAGEEFFELVRFCVLQFTMSSGGVCIRFGDTENSGATVTHLHAHILEPKKLGAKDFEGPIRFFIGPREK